MTGRRAAGLLLALWTVAGAAACGSGPSATTTTSGASTSASSTSSSTAAPAVSAAPAANPCPLGAQSPPAGTVSAAYPTALAFAPDGRLFWTERAGTVKVWQDGVARTFATVSTVTTEAGGGYSERGLLGIAIPPTFTQTHFVYAFYSNADRVHQTVERWTDCAGTGTNPTTLITLPSGSDCCHKGGRLAFAPDGHLYVTLGEEHTAPQAQNTGSVLGKLLRYNADGGIPADNPFGAGNPVWAYGLRNPFGIAVSAGGQVAITNNGPSGDAGSPPTGYDTVLASVARGSGHQWALCYGYSHPILPTSSGCGGQPGPDWSSEASTVVPTGATFVDASGPAGYAGHLVFCTFNSGGRILGATRPATVTGGPAQCKLDVKQAPNHALYFSDTTAIYRLG
ncbi:MAG TPA: PQQ-dependent sugar dehydrogenase [Candidatus Dormibacteraeota bacterium]|nr:PQQ-dependent sugar dehydrogenase [Candidatus Dormibacteraeota bacterium]